MTYIDVLQDVVKTRKQLIAELKELFDHYNSIGETVLASETQFKLESLWCENEADKQRIESLKINQN